MFTSKRFWATLAALATLVGAVYAGDMSISQAIMSGVAAVAALVLGDSLRTVSPPK
jgi:dihydrodipicolinate reductase